jgi:thiol-disulfide isomerase/thioredoxin
MMLIRTGIALLLIGFAFGAYVLATRWQIRQIARRTNCAPALEGMREGIPTVVYFWSEACAPCKAVQSPAVKQLVSKLGPDGVQIIEINALERPEIADAWGVLGLPTTFIVDGCGQPRHVNHGVARVEKLERQLAMLG